MRLGKLTKGAVSVPAVSLDEAADYLNAPTDAPALEGAVLGAIRLAEANTAVAFDTAVYTLDYSGFRGGESILLPEYADIVLSGTPTGITLDAFSVENPVVTLGEGAALAGTLAFRAGACPDDVKQSILYLASVDFYGKTPDKLPGLVKAPLDNASRVWSNSIRPALLASYDADTGAFRVAGY